MLYTCMYMARGGPGRLPRDMKGMHKDIKDMHAYEFLSPCHCQCGLMIRPQLP